MGFRGIAPEQLLLNERETTVVEQATKSDTLLETMADDAHVFANRRVRGIAILVYLIDLVLRQYRVKPFSVHVTIQGVSAI